MPLPVLCLVICLSFCVKVTLRVVLLQLQVSLHVSGKGTIISEYARGNSDSSVCSLTVTAMDSL